MDRIDLVVDVRRTDPSNVLGTGGGTSSATLREKVLEARERRSSRKASSEVALSEGSATMPSADRILIRGCGLGDRERRMFETVSRRTHLSGRAIIRTLRVARTIADLEGHERVGEEHLLEALAFRVREMGAA